MSVISNSLRSLSAFLQDHQVSFSNGLLIIFTMGGEHIFRFQAFRCPCSQNDAYYYALTFMLAPALILGIIGVAVSNLTWRLLHGCRHRSKETANGLSKTSGYLFMSIARASVVPFAWLFVALLDGNYYACMLAKNPCEKASEEILHLIAESQTIAWIALGGLILLSFIVICCVRCCDSVTYVQYKYLNSYREAEQEQMNKLIQEATKTMAESNVKIFITKPQLNKNDWDGISRVPDLTMRKNENEDEGNNLKVPSSIVAENIPLIFLTPLDEWANKQPQRNQPQDQNTNAQLQEQAVLQSAA